MTERANVLAVLADISVAIERLIAVLRICGEASEDSDA